jgi:hypothetical protein
MSGIGSLRPLVSQGVVDPVVAGAVAGDQVAGAGVGRPYMLALAAATTSPPGPVIGTVWVLTACALSAASHDRVAQALYAALHSTRDSP